MTPETQVGQIERMSQNRVASLFRDRLGYEYLGNWEDREENSNIEISILRSYLSGAGYTDIQIDRAIEKLIRVAGDQSKGLYEVNKEVYGLLRYGVNVRAELGEHTQDIQLINWNQPEKNHFALAEEVTVLGNRTKRPDIVLYVNGIAIGVLELKRSTVAASEGIRQNIGNQNDAFIRPFFTTMQLVMAGNDTEGLFYGTTETPEDYYLTWKEDGHESELRLDKHLLQMCSKNRILELIHDFIIFDSGVKKTCRHNQFFGVNAARAYAKEHKSGIIWHTQGSGKSLTMVWLAKWIRENIDNSRVLVLTDRTELDEQIEGVFNGVNERIYRTTSSRDLVEKLNSVEENLICSLIHKFGRKTDVDEADIEKYITEIREGLEGGFDAKGDVFVFVDECHRTHTGKLHEAMKVLLPRATFIGFTGTPLLKIDTSNSVVVWGPYIHTYKYDQAVRDGVVLDLRYEARRVDQHVVQQDKINEWFEERTKGLTDAAKVELKGRWVTMQTLLSSASRLERVVFDILDDFYKKPRLASGRGNAILVASTIYEACRYYELFEQQGFTKCAVVTSYDMNALSTESREFGIYRRMIDNYRLKHGAIERKTSESETQAFERVVKARFIKYPGQMQLLIVVDKLLTGFDAPSATYLYIDKEMKDHGLFQAICRVNRLDGEDKEYGFIIDYRDLFKRLETAVTEYTSEAFNGYEKDDVLGLLKDRVEEGKKDLDDALDVVRALCEPVEPPKGSFEYIRYFCGDVENPYAVKETEHRRVQLYRKTSHLLRLYADMANDMTAAGYSSEKSDAISKEVDHYQKVRQEVKLASGDYIDLKKYEPAMRTLIDRYVDAHESQVISKFDDMTLVDLLVSRGKNAIESLPEGVKQNQEATAETIENNVRRLIIDETPSNPKYYQRMSELLSELIDRRKREDMAYQEYLAQIIELSKQVKNPGTSQRYPASIQTRGMQALYDNLGEDEERTKKVHGAILGALTADWIGKMINERRVTNAIEDALQCNEDEAKKILEIIKQQSEYR